MLTTIVTFIILLSVLVLVHEFGHFLVAKRTGVRVEEFGIGFPPRLTGVRVGETIYSINLLPIGGFVRLTGEEEEPSEASLPQPETPTKKVVIEEKYLEAELNGKKIVAETAEIEVLESTSRKSLLQADPKSFANKTNFVKAGILTGGVLMNFLLGVALFGIVFSFLGVPEIKNVVEIQGVIKKSPAYKAGIKVGDAIVGYKDAAMQEYKEIENGEEFVEFIKQNLGKEFKLKIQRASSTQILEADTLGYQSGQESAKEKLEITVKAREKFIEEEGALGIKFIVVPLVSYKEIAAWKVPVAATSESAKLAGLMFSGIRRIFADLVTKKVVPKDLAGPVGIAKVTSEVAKEGFFQVLQFAGLLSINLGVVNILPFPGLDGGRLLFVVTEGVLGRKIHPKYQRWVHTIGVALLFLLMLIVTFYDIVRIF